MNKTVQGMNEITYVSLQNNAKAMMQIDMHKPLKMDSILLDISSKLIYTREGNVFHIQVPPHKKSSIHKI